MQKNENNKRIIFECLLIAREFSPQSREFSPQNQLSHPLGLTAARTATQENTLLVQFSSARLCASPSMTRNTFAGVGEDTMAWREFICGRCFVSLRNIFKAMAGYAPLAGIDFCNHCQHIFQCNLTSAATGSRDLEAPFGQQFAPAARRRAALPPQS